MRSAPPRSRPIPRGARPLGSSRRSSVTGSPPSIPAAPPTSSVCRWPGASASDGPRVRRPVPCTAPRHERSMDLALTEGQEMLRSTARNFMEREAPVDVVVGLQKLESSLASDLWRKAARLGWLGIVIPAEYGGSGDRLSDAAVLYEELGRGPLPGPFFSSGVLGALTVLEGASEEQRRRLLPGIAIGERVLTVAITEPNASWGPAGITLTPQGKNGGYTLNGTKLFVSDATSATDLVVDGCRASSRGSARCRSTTSRCRASRCWAMRTEGGRHSPARSSARCRCSAPTSSAPARPCTRSPSSTRRRGSSSACPSAGSSACRITWSAW